MAKEKENTGEMIVRDPEVILPKNLPLIVEPAGGIDPNKPFDGWKNEAQQKYARIINAYAYKNPDKWKLKKNTRTDTAVLNGAAQSVKVKGMLETLTELGEMDAGSAEMAFAQLNGTNPAIKGAVGYKDHNSPTLNS